MFSFFKRPFAKPPLQPPSATFSMVVSITVFLKENSRLRESVKAEGHVHEWDHSGAVNAF